MATQLRASLCPHCLKRIPAERVREGDNIYLVKTCPEHGEFTTLIWRGTPSLEGWGRAKAAVHTTVPHAGEGRGCPFDCGICSEHRQQSCTVLIEVTGRCNLRCPFCFADSGDDSGPDPSPADLAWRFLNALRKSGPHNIVQISGGEPTVRDDLPEIISLGRTIGFPFIQLNTNGVRLAAEPGYAVKLKEAGLFSVFLQFDGTQDRIYRTIRGRALLEEKMRAIQQCSSAGLGIVLVPTIVKGVNDGDIGAILRLALELAPAVRGVHFQPAAYFGRHLTPPPAEERLTLPDLMRAIQQQTDGLIRADHFIPPGCEHPLCSFHGNFLRQEDGSLKPLSRQAVDCSRGDQQENWGTGKAVSYVVNQWAAPKPASCCPARDSLDAFLENHRSNTFAISAMAFQDVWSLDLERVQECCIHVAAPDGRMIPFCLYNLTSSDGTPLYRDTCDMSPEMSFSCPPPSPRIGMDGCCSPLLEGDCCAPESAAADETCACAPVDVGHRSGCPVCGKKILDISPPKTLSCRYCGKTALVEHCCEEGHFVCDQCRIQAVGELITASCLTSSHRDTLAILHDIRSNPHFPTHGPHHHPMVPGILLAAYRNNGGDISDERIMAGIARGAQIPGAFCSFFGVDGAAIGVGIAFSVLLGATPFEGTKRNLVQKIVIRVASKIAEHAAARCCQREVWIALNEAEEISRELLPVPLPARYPLRCDQFGTTDHCSGMACPLRRTMPV
ncbi:Radical SAM domain protein [Pelobacter propionicus DSM 2379]|uniref:Radical SAM domain protein n=2 Tax=Pelobacter propionicus TaxID=29543 RepID=A1AQC7_PELPD|nr:Radical SAM domain protein [Pelobacter propionicus DSM 2379]